MLWCKQCLTKSIHSRNAKYEKSFRCTWIAEYGCVGFRMSLARKSRTPERLCPINLAHRKAGVPRSET